MHLGNLVTPWLVWFLLGVAVAFLELYLPGFIVLFFGFGCWVTAAAVAVWDLSLTAQVGTFITASVLSLLLLRKWLIGVFRGASSDSLDDGLDDFPHGARVTVRQTITPSVHGRIQYRGTTWPAAADETIEAGSPAEIVDYFDKSRQIFIVRKID